MNLAKHGGLAAAIRRPPVTVDSSALPENKAAELAPLVAAAKAELQAAEAGPGRARDAMSYTITLQDDSGETTTLRASDTTMSRPFAALLEWLDRNAAGK
ncbi:MAG: protealysin inhibitor emfourin [Bryobacterales bacterium]